MQIDDCVFNYNVQYVYMYNVNLQFLSMLNSSILLRLFFVKMRQISRFAGAATGCYGGYRNNSKYQSAISASTTVATVTLPAPTAGSLPSTPADPNVFSSRQPTMSRTITPRTVTCTTSNVDEIQIIDDDESYNTNMDINECDMNIKPDGESSTSCNFNYSYQKNVIKPNINTPVNQRGRTCTIAMKSATESGSHMEALSGTYRTENISINTIDCNQCTMHSSTSINTSTNDLNHVQNSPITVIKIALKSELDKMRKNSKNPPTIPKVDLTDKQVKLIVVIAKFSCLVGITLITTAVAVIFSVLMTYNGMDYFYASIMVLTTSIDVTANAASLLLQWPFANGWYQKLCKPCDFLMIRLCTRNFEKYIIRKKQLNDN